MKNSASAEIDVRKEFQINGTTHTLYSPAALGEYGYKNIDHLPFSIRILLENLLRNGGTDMVRREDIDNLASWRPDMDNPGSIPFMPGRIVLQDFTGVPALGFLHSRLWMYHLYRQQWPAEQ